MATRSPSRASGAAESRVSSSQGAGTSKDDSDTSSKDKDHKTKRENGPSRTRIHTESMKKELGEGFGKYKGKQAREMTMAEKQARATNFAAQLAELEKRHDEKFEDGDGEGNKKAKAAGKWRWAAKAAVVQAQEEKRLSEDKERPSFSAAALPAPHSLIRDAQKEHRSEQERRNSMLDKVFGTSTEVGEEHVEEEAEGVKVAINPMSVTRARLDLVVVLLVMYTLIMLPIRTAFGDDDDGPLFYIDLLIDFFLLAEVLVNFNTGYDDDGNLEMDARKVRHNYVKSWLLPDLLSSLPMELLTVHGLKVRGQGGRRELWRVPRLLRLLRFPRLMRYVHRWEDRLPIYTSTLRTLKLVLCIALFSHLNACIQFLAARLEDFPDDGWVVRSGILDASSFEQYTHALFNALSHMLCIGYGLTVPKTDTDILITIISMMTGASLYVVLVGMISSLMLNLDRAGSRFHQKVDVWKQYFNYRGLPKEIRERVLAYFEYRWHTRKVFDERAMLGELTTCLRTDVSMFVCEELLNHVPIFKFCSPCVISAVACALDSLFCLPEEYIYTDGQIASDMYFIVDGRVQLILMDGTLGTTLGRGSYFGEFPLLFRTHTTRSSSARAAGFTQLYTWHIDSFRRVTSIHPQISQIMKAIALARLKQAHAS